MNTSDESTKELMFQYDLLRQEILAGGGITAQILAATTLVTGVVISIISSNAVDENAVAQDWAMGGLFLIAGVIAVAGLEDILTRTRVTHTIASYLRIFVEPKTHDIRWETRLQDFRENSPSSRFGFMPPQFWMHTGLIVVNAGMCGLHLFLALDARSFLGLDVRYSRTIAVLVGTAVVAVAGWFIIRAYNIIRDLTSPDGGDIEKCWKKIKEEEDKGLRTSSHEHLNEMTPEGGFTITKSGRRRFRDRTLRKFKPTADRLWRVNMRLISEDSA